MGKELPSKETLANTVVSTTSKLRRQNKNLHSSHSIVTLCSFSFNCSSFVLTLTLLNTTPYRFYSQCVYEWSDKELCLNQVPTSITGNIDRQNCVRCFLKSNGLHQLMEGTFTGVCVTFSLHESVESRWGANINTFGCWCTIMNNWLSFGLWCS